MKCNVHSVVDKNDYQSHDFVRYTMGNNACKHWNNAKCASVKDNKIM